MKVLLDHNLPHKLRAQLASQSNHDIVTASFLGWGHLANGELLRAAEEEGFQVFLTGDRTLVHEQNPGGRTVAILALSANNWPIIQNCFPIILAALEKASPGSFCVIDCGTFSRKPAHK